VKALGDHGAIDTTCPQTVAIAKKSRISSPRPASMSMRWLPSFRMKEPSPLSSRGTISWTWSRSRAPLSGRSA